MLIIPLIYSWVCLLLKKLCEREKRFHSNENRGRFSRGTRGTVLPLEGGLISASLIIIFQIFRIKPGEIFNNGIDPGV